MGAEDYGKRVEIDLREELARALETSTDDPKIGSLLAALGSWVDIRVQDIIDQRKNMR